MAFALRKKFQGKEDEVVKAIHELGIDDAMSAYGCRSRVSFINWLRNHTSDSWEALRPLAGLTGGEKAKLMRDHRNTILDELEVFGKDWVMEVWSINKDTLERFISFDNQPFINKLTPLQRAELNSKEALRIAREVKQQIDTFKDRFGIIDEERRAERHTVIELQEAYSSFSESVSNQLSQGIVQIFRTMLEQGIKVDNLLPPPAEKPDLSIESLIEQGEKHPKEEQGESPLALTTRQNKLKGVYLSAHPFAKG